MTFKPLTKHRSIVRCVCECSGISGALMYVAGVRPGWLPPQVRCVSLAPRSHIPLRPPGESAAGYPARNIPGHGQGRSANLGVLAAVQPHDVGVVAALWLGDVGVLAAVQWRDIEAAPGE